MKVYVTPKQFASLQDMMMKLEDDISWREQIKACLGMAAMMNGSEGFSLGALGTVPCEIEVIY